MSVIINHIPIGEKTFPNNETIYNVPVILDNQDITIEFNFESDADITILSVTKKYLDDVYPDVYKILLMKYIPYSRMDRRIKNFMFSLKYFCDIVNSLNFNEVISLDPHSYVSSALINRIREIDVQKNIDSILSLDNFDYFFYPDAGAQKRYTELIHDRPYFYGNKKRDLQNGNILGFELVNCPENIQGKDILIVDDLCAKGGTFMASAEQLRNAGVRNISLYVSHCENTIFKGNILDSDYIKKIYTTNSIITKEHPKIHILGDKY